jgi:hypothetical protein
VKSCRRLVGVLACLLLAGGVAQGAEAAGAVPASALAGCPSFKFVRAGTQWTASNVRVKQASCLTARNLITSYARPMNCQFRFACHIGRYVCRTIRSLGSTFQEACVKGSVSVSWSGGYVSR